MIKEAFYTRMMFLKKQFGQVAFWVLLPTIVTLIFIASFDRLQEDTEVPIGIVLDEDSEMTRALYERIDETSHIRPVILQERDAINRLKRHNLDSVFIVEDGYEENTLSRNRDSLITSFQTDLSFSYAPIKEVIISYVQQDYSRMRAAHVIRDLGVEYGVVNDWTVEELINRSREIEKEQDLLRVNFSYLHENVERESEQSFVTSKNIWALLTMFATFILFDWVIKERRSSTMLRLPFMKVSPKQYVLYHLFIYTIVLFIVDCFMYFFILSEPFTMTDLLSLASFRLTINMTIFLWALLFRSSYAFYTSAFTIALLFSIVGGIFIPLDTIYEKYPLYKQLNPFQPFLAGAVFNIWFIGSLVVICVWYLARGRKDVTHQVRP